jgi:hypothetical protein
LVEHLDAAFARIWTLNEQNDILELQASAGIYTHIDGAHSRVPVGQFKIGLIAKERKPHITNDVVNDPRIGDREDGAVTLDTNSISECGSIAPTAATVSVSGRVLSSRGRGISNAMVHLINQNGEIQTYKTNRSGYYTFQDIEVGETYIFNVYAKRYFFNAQVITLTEELAELDFTAQ